MNAPIKDTCKHTLPTHLHSVIHLWCAFPEWGQSCHHSRWVWTSCGYSGFFFFVFFFLSGLFFSKIFILESRELSGICKISREFWLLGFVVFFGCVQDGLLADTLITWPVSHTWTCIVLQNVFASVFSSQEWCNIEEWSPPRLPSFSVLPTRLVYLDEVVILWKPHFLDLQLFCHNFKMKNVAQNRIE